MKKLKIKVWNLVIEADGVPQWVPLLMLLMGAAWAVARAKSWL
ncbi:hypothetical protein [Phaeobacter italicus]|jgi:hypothetical protein